MKKLIFLLISRPLLFVLFQAIIAFFLTSWNESANYWILAATLTNITSFLILLFLSKKEGISYFSMFSFDASKRKTDMVWFLIILIISVPLAVIPSLAISNLFWGNTEYYHSVLFQPLNRGLVYFLLLAYPVTTGLSDLVTYFGYIMPRFKNRMKSQWLALALPVLFFSVQHCTLPLVFEVKFIIFRSIMYLLFSFVLGLALFKRPSLLPWMAILQAILYFLPVLMVLTLTLNEAG